jgi:hypothetical protein
VRVLRSFAKAWRRAHGDALYPNFTAADRELVIKKNAAFVVPQVGDNGDDIHQTDNDRQQINTRFPGPYRRRD